eukprot:14593371-Ditylum_brightwellii.AAC.1
MYAAQLGLCGAYSKKFKTKQIDELVRWDGILVHNGVRGGSGGAIHCCWQESADHDLYTDECIKYCCFIQIKC